MSMSSDDQAWRVAIAFHERYWTDREGSGAFPLSHYVSLFPGHASLVAREYAHAESVADEIVEIEPLKPHAGHPAPTSRLGHYRIDREVGRGGQGIVYRAIDLRLGRWVALKVLVTRDDPLGDRLLRFEREAFVASRIEHPGICGVFEAGTEGGRAWIAMRWVEGETLAERLRRMRGRASPTATWADRREERTRRAGNSAWKPIAAFFAEAARALEAAHAAGVVHRDLKPGNLMVTGGTPEGSLNASEGSPILRPEEHPVILDFGLARDQRSDEFALTLSSELFGTPAYMAPEQIQAKGADARADVYALGVCLFEALTLERPYDAPTREALFRQILSVEAPDLRRVAPHLPRDLATVVATALSKEPSRRYQAAASLAADLESVLGHRPVLARPLGPLGRCVRWARREPFRAALVVLLVLGLPLVTALLTFVVANREKIATAENAERLAEVEALLERGYLLVLSYGRGNAVPFFERALQLDPENLEAVAGVAFAFRYAHRLREALAWLEQRPALMRRSPSLVRLRRELSILLSETPAQEPPAAHAGPETASERFVAASAVFARGFRGSPSDAREGLALFISAVQRARRARPLYHFHALCAAALAGDEKLVTELSAAVQELWPRSALAHAWIGFSRFHTGSLSESLESYERAAALDPDLNVAWLGRIVVLTSSGKPREAYDLTKRARERYPRDMAIRMCEVECLRQLERFDEARSLAEAYVAENSRDPTARLALGRVLLEGGRALEALQVYEQLGREYPRWDELLINTAAALTACGRRGDAARVYRTVLESVPDHVDALGGLGTLALDDGRCQEARTFFSRALERRPTDPALMNNLAVALERDGAASAAVPLLRRALELRPHLHTARLTLGRALMATEARGEAIATYQETVRRAPTFAEAWCNLGLALRDEGRYREALDCLRKGHALGSEQKTWAYPSSHWVAEIEQLVDLERERDDMLKDDVRRGSRAGWIQLAELSARQRRRGDEARCFERALGEPGEGTFRLKYRLAGACVAAHLQETSGAVESPWCRRALSLLEELLRELEGQSARGERRPRSILKELDGWLEDEALSSLRDEASRRRLPAPVAARSHLFWSSVEALKERLLL